MTKNEFKAWFDGFCEGMEGAPNDKQWERIKARVAEIDDKPIPYPVYVDRYVAPYRPYWPNVPYWGGGGTYLDAKSSVSASSGAMSVGSSNGEVFSFNDAMKDAGRAEYRAALNS